MVCEVVGGVRYDGVGKSRFPIYDISKVCGGSCLMMSRYFRAWYCSVSAVNCDLGCNALKSLRMLWMLVRLESKIRKISSTYRQ